MNSAHVVPENDADVPATTPGEKPHWMYVSPIVPGSPPLTSHVMEYVSFSGTYSGYSVNVTVGSATAATASKALTTPQPVPVSQPGMLRSLAVSLMLCPTSSGVSAGFTDSITAATPATCGAAADVPDRYW